LVCTLRSDGTTPNAYGGAPFVRIDAWNSNPQVVKLQDASDGLSNTLLFAELVQGKTQTGIGTDLRGFAWWNGGCHFETYLPPNATQPDAVESNCFPQIPGNPPCVVATTANPSSIASRSRHPGGVQAALCDGSVQFFSNSINLDTWRFLGTAYGKEAVQGF